MPRRLASSTSAAKERQSSAPLSASCASDAWLFPDACGAAIIPADAQVAPRPGCARSRITVSIRCCASRQPIPRPATPAPIMTTFIFYSYQICRNDAERLQSVKFNLAWTCTMLRDPNHTENDMEKATFGAGCFWGVESFFREVPGVVDAV